MPGGERGEIFVVSAPSGTGKTTLCRRACEHVENLTYSISYTTRVSRMGEEHGVDYYFVGDATFDKMVDLGAFLEWAWVYGCRYGTSKRQMEEQLERGLDVIIDVDVQGADQLRCLDLAAHYIFVMPPSWEVLRDRLCSRGTESREAIAQRLTWAREELRQYDKYDFVILNQNLGGAIRDMESVIRGQRCRVDRRGAWIQGTLKNWIAAQGL